MGAFGRDLPSGLCSLQAGVWGSPLPEERSGWGAGASCPWEAPCHTVTRDAPPVPSPVNGMEVGGWPGRTKGQPSPIPLVSRRGQKGREQRGERLRLVPGREIFKGRKDFRLFWRRQRASDCPRGRVGHLGEKGILRGRGDSQDGERSWVLGAFGEGGVSPRIHRNLRGIT